MASGLPVIAYAAGGAIETIVDGESGLLFHDPTVEGLVRAVERVERGLVTFDEAGVRSRANAFTKDRFRRGVLEAIRGAWSDAGKSPAALEAALRDDDTV